MKSLASGNFLLCSLALLISNAFFLPTQAFTISSQTKLIHRVGFVTENPAALIKLRMGFMGGDDDAKKLTRDSEPDRFFSTNTDKMSDEEKIPLALGGIAFISLPFILGLVALYASK